MRMSDDVSKDIARRSHARIKTQPCALRNIVTDVSQCALSQVAHPRNHASRTRTNKVTSGKLARSHTKETLDIPYDEKEISGPCPETMGLYKGGPQPWHR